MVDDLVMMDADELGKLVRMNEEHRSALEAAAQQFPKVEITRSLTRGHLDTTSSKILVEVDWFFT